MPTVIDQFVIELGLDTSQLQKGQNQQIQQLRNYEREASRGGRAIEDQFGQSVRSIVGFVEGLATPTLLLRRHLEAVVTPARAAQQHIAATGDQGKKTGEAIETGALAGASGLRVMASAALIGLAAVVALGKAWDGFKKVAEGTFTTGLRAAAAGLPVQQVSQLSQALLTHGNVPEEQTQNWLAGIAQSQQAALTYGTPLPDYFKNLGIQGVTDQFESPDKMLQQLATTFARLYPNTPQGNSAAVAAGAGLQMSPEMSLALRNAGANLGNLAAGQAGTQVTPQEEQAARQFLDDLRQIEVEFSKMGRELLVDFGPQLHAAAEGLMEFARAIRAIAAAATGHWGDIPGILRGDTEPGKQIGGATPEEQDILNQIRHTESRGNYGARRTDGGTASGGYGFIDQTWKEATAATGLGREFARASDAPPDIQDANALWLYRNRGQRPWTGGKGQPTAYYPSGVGGVAQRGAAAVTGPGAGLLDPYIPSLNIGRGKPPPAATSNDNWQDTANRWLYDNVFGPSKPINPSGGIDQNSPAGANVMNMLSTIRAGSAAGAAPASSNTTINVGDVNVTTQATDAQGTATAVRQALQRNIMVAQANTGLV